MTESTPAPERYNWARLTSLQTGRYAEYYVKMEFTLFGFDVYGTEVDDKGIDFVVRRDESRYYDVQVKSSRKFNYIFFQKEKFELRDRLLAAIVLLLEGEPPHLYLIPSTAWLEPNSVFVDRQFAGLRSKPEWGMNLSRKALAILEPYSFEHMANSL